MSQSSSGKDMLFGTINVSYPVCVQMCVSSLTPLQQGWMLLLSVWISFRKEQSKKLLVSQTWFSLFTTGKKKSLPWIFMLILVMGLLILQWCDTVFGVSFQGEEVWSSQHCPPDWPHHSGQLRAPGRYYWKPETGWHHSAVFVRLRHIHQVYF